MSHPARTLFRVPSHRLHRAVSLPLACVTTMGIVLLAPPGVGQSTPPADPAPVAQPAKAEDKPAVAAGIVLPANLESMSAVELIALIKDLAMQNNVLAARIHAMNEAARTAKPLPDASAATAALIAEKDAEIARLQNSLRLAKARLATQDTVAEVPPTPPATSVEEVVTPPSARAEGKYSYLYEFGLIEASSSKRTVVRDSEGKVTVVTDTAQYRKDAVWVRVLFQNTDSKPLRYSGLMALARKSGGLFVAHDVITTTGFSTPLLQPGEVYEWERDVNVDNPFAVNFIEVGRVSAFASDDAQ